MDRREPSPSREFKPRKPKWSSPIWYLPIMFLVLWFLQSAVLQIAYKTIPYSEFKEHLRRGEVVECTVKESVIEGRLSEKAQLTSDRSSTNASPGQKATARDFLFRTVRVEDPTLVQDM